MYDDIARFYDLAHQQLVEDIPFMLDRAARSGPAARLLELGCGSGRLLLPLAEAGWLVTGLDVSHNMLLLTRQKLEGGPPAVQARVHLVEGNMAAFAFAQQFELILISYNTVLHLDPQALGRCLRCVRRHLSPDGRLLVDLHNPLDLLSLEDAPDAALEQTLVDPASGRTIHQFGRHVLDSASQVLALEWIFEEEGGMRRSLTARYHLHLPHQLELAAAEAGLKITEMLGNYEGEPFDEQAERLIFTAEPSRKSAGAEKP